MYTEKAYTGRYDASKYNSLMNALDFLEDESIKKIIRKIERYSYFEASEMYKREEDRMATVTIETADLIKIIDSFIRRTAPQTGRTDWFQKIAKEFEQRHGNPEWFSRFILRPFDRARLEKLGAAAEEILSKKGRSAIRFAGFHPPTEPVIFFADVMAGWFLMESKTDRLSYVYEIRLFEKEKKWRVCETASKILADGLDMLHTSEKEINFETLEVNQ